jgi:hypothetical protein
MATGPTAVPRTTPYNTPPLATAVLYRMRRLNSWSPSSVGENVTSSVHLLLAARVCGPVLHVPPETEKGGRRPRPASLRSSKPAGTSVTFSITNVLVEDEPSARLPQTM